MESEVISGLSGIVLTGSCKENVESCLKHAFITSSLKALKIHVITYCEKVYERSGKKMFWSIKNSNEVLDKLKSRGFPESSLHTIFLHVIQLCLII